MQQRIVYGDDSDKSLLRGLIDCKHEPTLAETSCASKDGRLSMFAMAYRI